MSDSRFAVKRVEVKPLPPVDKVVIAFTERLAYFASVDGDGHWNCIFTRVALPEVICWKSLESLKDGSASQPNRSAGSGSETQTRNEIYSVAYRS